MSIEASDLIDLPLFSGLGTVELEEIAAHLVLREVPAQERIIKEGDAPGHPIYILLQGTVEVTKAGLHGRPHLISSLAAPSVFGEIEVLAKRPAIASVSATSDVRLAMLKRGVFDEMTQQNRSAALKIVKNLAQTLSFRLAATDERLATYFDFSDHLQQEKLGAMRSLLYSGWRNS